MAVAEAITQQKKTHALSIKANPLPKPKPKRKSWDHYFLASCYYRPITVLASAFAFWLWLGLGGIYKISKFSTDEFNNFVIAFWHLLQQYTRRLYRHNV